MQDFSNNVYHELIEHHRPSHCPVYVGGLFPGLPTAAPTPPIKLDMSCTCVPIIIIIHIVNYRRGTISSDTRPQQAVEQVGFGLTTFHEPNLHVA